MELYTMSLTARGEAKPIATIEPDVYGEDLTQSLCEYCCSYDRLTNLKMYHEHNGVVHTLAHSDCIGFLLEECTCL
jgi:hypothetical protein